MNITKIIGLILACAGAGGSIFTALKFFNSNTGASLPEMISSAALPVYCGLILIIGLIVYAIGIIQEK